MSMEPKTENPRPSFLEKLDQCPPFLLYYLSHHGHNGVRVTGETLVKESGLSERTFRRVAKLLSWKTVKVHVMDGYCRACGLDPFDSETVLALLAQEYQSENPFSAMTGRGRYQMMSMLNRLCAQHVLRVNRGNKP